MEPCPRTGEAQLILIVDDELDLWWGETFQKLFDVGYEVDAAEDGEAGWQAIQTKDYDLLITDNKMPKLWGLGLIRKLRSAQLALPVILASSALPWEALQRNPDLKIYSTVEKPVTVSELLDSVERVLHPVAPYATQ